MEEVPLPLPPFIWSPPSEDLASGGCGTHSGFVHTEAVTLTGEKLEQLRIQVCVCVFLLFTLWFRSR